MRVAIFHALEGKWTIFVADVGKKKISYVALYDQEQWLSLPPAHKRVDRALMISSPYSSLCRSLTVPFSGRRALKKILPFQIENVVPDLASNIITQVIAVKKRRQNTHLTLFLTNHDAIDQSLADIAPLYPSAQIEHTAFWHPLYLLGNACLGASLDTASLVLLLVHDSEATLLWLDRETVLATQRCPFGHKAVDSLEEYEQASRWIDRWLGQIEKEKLSLAASEWLFLGESSESWQRLWKNPCLFVCQETLEKAWGQRWQHSSLGIAGALVLAQTKAATFLPEEPHIVKKTLFSTVAISCLSVLLILGLGELTIRSKQKTLNAQLHLPDTARWEESQHHLEKNSSQVSTLLPQLSNIWLSPPQVADFLAWLCDHPAVKQDSALAWRSLKSIDYQCLPSSKLLPHAWPIAIKMRIDNHSEPFWATIFKEEPRVKDAAISNEAGSMIFKFTFLAPIPTRELDPL